MPDLLSLLEGAGAVAAIFAGVATGRSWYRSELRDARQEITQLLRDKMALERQILSLTSIAYPNGKEKN